MSKEPTTTLCLECGEEGAIICAEGVLCVECADGMDAQYDECDQCNEKQRVLTAKAFGKGRPSELRHVKYNPHPRMEIGNWGEDCTCPSCAIYAEAEKMDKQLQIHFTRLTGEEEARKVGFVMETLGLTPCEIEDRYDIDEQQVDAILDLWKYFKEKDNE